MIVMDSGPMSLEGLELVSFVEARHNALPRLGQLARKIGKDGSRRVIEQGIMPQGCPSYATREDDEHQTPC